MGKKSKTARLLRQVKGKKYEPKTPIASEMFLPNQSGDHSAGIVNTTPTQDTDIANKKYVDDEVAGASGLWEIDGTETQLITADEIDMQTKKIINVVDPTANQEAATKKYVDDNITVEVDPVFVAWDKDHADLSNVTANQHHAQSHTLASHSTKAHSELTGVTADQHHAQAHSHTHASTTGQTANDHHNEAHTHTHASTTGQTADDHHAQSHSLASHSTKAHTELTGVTASQHHTKAVSGDIDHDATVNTHNLTTDIDHDALTNFTQTEHFTEGSIDHGAIGGLTDDDHTQYLLLQPTAHVVINEAGGDFTFRIEGVSNPNIFNITTKTGVSVIGIGTALPLRTFHIVGPAANHAYLRLDAGAGGKHPVIELCEYGTRRAYLEYNASNNYTRISSEENNSDIYLMTVGTGRARFGTYVAGEVRSDGYIEIKDAGGTVRKVLVATPD